MNRRQVAALLAVAALAISLAIGIRRGFPPTGAPPEPPSPLAPAGEAAGAQGPLLAGLPAHAEPKDAGAGRSASLAADRPPAPPGTHRFTVTAADGGAIGRTRLVLRFAPSRPGGPGETRDVLVADREASVASEGDLVGIDAHPIDVGSPPLLARVGLVPSRGSRDHTIVLARGAWLRVRVRLPDGTPLDGARVIVRGPGAPDSYARCDADGRASCAVPAADTYAVELDGLAVRVVGGSVRVEPSPWGGALRGALPGDEVLLTAHALPLAALQVHVRMPDGRPAPGARVRVGIRDVNPPCAEATTDEWGVARTGDLPCRPYRVVLVPPAEGDPAVRLVAPPPATAMPGDTPLEVQFLPARTVRGRVMDADHAPYPRARVLLLQGGVEIAAIASDERGEFAFAIEEDRVGPFTLAARVWLPGGPILDGSVENVWQGDARVDVLVSGPR